MTSEEIIRLIDVMETAVKTACPGKHPAEITGALWAILLSSIMAGEGCSPPEAIKRVRDLCDECDAFASSKKWPPL